MAKNGLLPNVSTSKDVNEKRTMRMLKFEGHSDIFRFVYTALIKLDTVQTCNYRL